MTQTASLQIPTDWRDFLALTKPRVMSLVIFTGLCGLLAAPERIHPVLAFTAVLCIAVGAGGAAALNQWWEADIDAGMKRTSARPLPSGRMGRIEARDFGVALSVGSVLLMGVAIGWLAAAILAVSIVYYAVIYTIWLKPRTPQNIVIGGGAGAFPPLIGWVAATGEITLMPVVAGERATRRQILAYAILLLPLSMTPWWIDGTGAVYGLSALALSLAFVVLSARVGLRSPGEGDTMKPEKQMFAYSVIYLFALFAALVADRLIVA